MHIHKGSKYVLNDSLLALVLAAYCDCDSML